MRCSRLLLAGWYLLVSTSLPAVIVDHVVPLTKQVALLDFPCAHHDCGCKTAEQCRLRCCCHLTPPAKAQAGTQCALRHEAPGTVRVSYLSEVRCKGLPDPGHPSLGKLDPHLPPAASNRLVAVAARPHPVQKHIVSRFVFVDPPDKIPI